MNPHQLCGVGLYSGDVPLVSTHLRKPPVTVFEHFLKRRNFAVLRLPVRPTASHTRLCWRLMTPPLLMPPMSGSEKTGQFPAMAMARGSSSLAVSLVCSHLSESRLGSQSSFPSSTAKSTARSFVLQSMDFPTIATAVARVLRKVVKPLERFWHPEPPRFLPRLPRKLFLVPHTLNMVRTQLRPLTIPGGAVSLEPSPGYITDCKSRYNHNQCLHLS